MFADTTQVHLSVIKKIIEEQMSLMGPVAVRQAEGVEGLFVSKTGHEIKINGDGKIVITKLVKSYEDIFGQTAVEVCKEAAESAIKSFPEADKFTLPEILR